MGCVMCARTGAGAGGCQPAAATNSSRVRAHPATVGWCKSENANRLQASSLHVFPARFIVHIATNPGEDMWDEDPARSAAEAVAQSVPTLVIAAHACTLPTIYTPPPPTHTHTRP
jgi:hypothetical protein